MFTRRGWLAIETLQRDELVGAPSDRDPDGPWEWKRILNVFENAPAELVNLHTECGVIRATLNHPFYVPGKGFVAAEQLEIGDRFRTHDGSTVTLTDKSFNGEVEPVYNIQVEDHHTYFVDAGDGKTGVLVHNQSISSGLKGVDTVTHLGQAWQFPVEAFGTRDGDIKRAWEAMEAKFGKAIPAAVRDRGTWHHKVFNEETGEMLMVLVNKTQHDALGHSGAYDDYSRWVAKVISDPKMRNALTEERAIAVVRTLNNKKAKAQVLRRLAELGKADVIEATVKRLTGKFNLVIKEGGEVVAEGSVKRAGMRIAGKFKWLRRVGGKAIGPLVALGVGIWASGKAYANTGDAGTALAVGGRAAGRELVAADLVELGFEQTVVRGSNALGDEVDRMTIERTRRYYGDAVAKSVEQSIADRKTFPEIAAEIDRKRKERGETLLGSIGKAW